MGNLINLYKKKGYTIDKSNRNHYTISMGKNTFDFPLNSHLNKSSIDQPIGANITGGVIQPDKTASRILFGMRKVFSYEHAKLEFGYRQTYIDGKPILTKTESVLLNLPIADKYPYLDKYYEEVLKKIKYVFKKESL